ncbi:MAG: hypothetical protein AAGB51_11920 [Planctomycetota bacterium]
MRIPAQPSQPRTRTTKRPGFVAVHTSVLLTGVWLALAIAGFIGLGVYANTPGRPTTGILRWPSDSGLALCEHSPTVVVFLHPRCDCSHATLANLARALPGLSAAPRIIGVLGHPLDKDPEDWCVGSLRTSLSRLPNSELRFDPEGVEAARFGATTSGHVMVFMPTSEPVFSGGLTIARGHEGRNGALDMFVRLLAAHEAPPQLTCRPVFGCELVLPKVSRGHESCDALGSCGAES